MIKNNAMPCTPHDYWVFGFSVIILYGHSSASFLKSLGFDLKDIQVWLRHKDIQTTMNLYTHLDMEAKTNIANNLDARLRGMNAVS